MVDLVSHSSHGTDRDEVVFYFVLHGMIEAYRQGVFIISAVIHRNCTYAE